MNVLIMTIAFIGAWAITTFSQGTDIGTVENQQTIIWTSIFGFLSLLATQLFSIWRDHLKGKRDKQERDDARATLAANLAAQKLETIETAVQLARVARQHNEAIAKQIAQNTELTKQVGEKAEAAYEIGNNFHQKMEALRQELYGSKTQIDHIEQVSEDTNVKVTEIKDEVKGPE